MRVKPKEKQMWLFMNAENREEVYFVLYALHKPIYTNTIVGMDGTDYKILGFGDWYYDLEQKEKAEIEYSAMLDARKKIGYEAGMKNRDMINNALEHCVIWRYRDVYLEPVLKKVNEEKELVPTVDVDGGSGKIIGIK